MRLAVSALALGFLLATGGASADGHEADLYAAECAKCHGPDGKGDTPVGKAMKVPSLVGAGLTADAIAAVIRENPKHSAIAKKLSPADVDAVSKAALAAAGG